MSIQSFEDLDKAIQQVPGKPTVLEALWDGDTQGWFLCLALYATTGNIFSKKTSRSHLGIISFGGDIRLFSGEVPAWPEAALAKIIGQQAANKYGLTFYFPSDKAPDDDCPDWTQKHLAIECADCGKLIIPTDSPYQPKEICYHCHLARESNEAMKQNKLNDNIVFATYQEKGNPAMHRDLSLHWYLREQMDYNHSNNEINVTMFSNGQLMALKNKIYLDIKERIANHQPSTFTGERRKFAAFEMVSFEGKEYELAQQFHDAHRTLSSLIRRHKTLEEAEQNGWTYYLHVIKGIRYRDDVFLRFIHFVSKGAAGIPAFHERYQPLLTTSEIMETLNKLEVLGAVTIKNEKVKITEFGENLL